MDLLLFLHQRRIQTEEEEEQEEVNQPRQRRPRQLLDRVNPIEAFTDYDFLKFYRLSKQTVIELAQIVSPLLEKPNNRGLPLNPLQCVCLTLSFLASAAFQRITGRLIGKQTKFLLLLSF